MDADQFALAWVPTSYMPRYAPTDGPSSACTADPAVSIPRAGDSILGSLVRLRMRSLLRGALSAAALAFGTQDVREALRALPAGRLAAAGTGEHAKDRVSDRPAVCVEAQQDPRGEGFVVINEPEQDVLAPDVVVPEAQRLAKCAFQGLLRATGEGHLGQGLLTRSDCSHEFGAHAVGRDDMGLEGSRGYARLLTEQAEQEVLGADVVVPKSTRFCLPADDHLTSGLRKSFEHPQDEHTVTASAPRPFLSDPSTKHAVRVTRQAHLRLGDRAPRSRGMNLHPVPGVVVSLVSIERYTEPRGGNGVSHT